MAITAVPFGTLSDGQEAHLWTLTSPTGCQAEILDFGAAIRRLMVPDRNGKLVDVVLGYDTLHEYETQDGAMGATIGRYANRIGKGTFELNGQTYHVFINNGPNALHGGKIGYHQRMWQAQPTEDGLKLTIFSPDGEEGYPGNLTASLTYSWEGSTLCLRYEATTDADTIVNLTNHTYFNLNGHGDCLEHVLTIHADSYLEADADCLPTGRILPVEGTAMDFRQPKAIGRDIHNDEPCVKPTQGYDGCYRLNGTDAAKVTAPETGITMTVETDQPSMQCYASVALTTRAGKNGTTMGQYSALCLESQHDPDGIHHPDWPTQILRAGETFRSYTKYGFSVE